MYQLQERSRTQAAFAAIHDVIVAPSGRVVPVQNDPVDSALAVDEDLLAPGSARLLPEPQRMRSWRSQ